MRKIAAMTAVGLALSSTVLAGNPATAADHSQKKLTVYMAFGTREVLDLGQTGPTIGDITVGTGPIDKKLGGKEIGDYVYRAENVAVLMPGAVESRFSTIWVNLSDGSLVATSLMSAPAGAPPVSKQQFVVVGGTGKYAGIKGTMILKPIKKPRASRLTFTYSK